MRASTWRYTSDVTISCGSLVATEEFLNVKARDPAGECTVLYIVVASYRIKDGMAEVKVAFTSIHSFIHVY